MNRHLPGDAEAPPLAANTCGAFQSRASRLPLLALGECSNLRCGLVQRSSPKLRSPDLPPHTEQSTGRLDFSQDKQLRAPRPLASRAADNAIANDLDLPPLVLNANVVFSSFGGGQQIGMSRSCLRLLDGRQNHFHLYTLSMTPTLILTAALLVGLGLNQINEYEKEKKR